MPAVWAVEKGAWSASPEDSVSGYEDYVAGDSMGKVYSACDVDYGYVAAGEVDYGA